MNQPRKHVCVIGLGFFGAGLARELAPHSEVLAIDKDINRVNKLSEDVQRALCIDVMDYQTLCSAVTDRFDEAIIAIGEELEASILCTLYLKRIGIPIIRAKASSEEHAEILRSIGATHVIFPELETAERLSLIIRNPNMLDFVPITEGYLMMDVNAPQPFHGRTLESLHVRNRFGVFILAIKKDQGKQFIFLPGPTYAIAEGDILVIIGREEDASKLHKYSE
jgi:trk system potassium uptake protein TrkA